ncbi:MAG: hypothetical protein ABL886_02235 [Rhodoglobus sp.]
MTGPCSFSKDPASLGTPVANLLACFDACVYCCGEAARALTLLERALRGEDVFGKFLPPEVIAARILASQMREDRRERGRASQPRFTPRFVVEDDDTMTIHAGWTNADGSTKRERSIENPSSQLPLRLRRYARHLITWANLIGYLQKHGIVDVPKTLKKNRAAAPDPVWEASSHRSLYRFASAMKSAKALSNRPDTFEELPENAWLRERVLPPDHRPAWASATELSRTAPEQTGRQATAKRR